MATAEVGTRRAGRGAHGRARPSPAQRWRQRAAVRLARVDATTVASLFVLLLFLVPSRLVVRPVGGTGTPANLLALGALLWWATARLVPGLGGARGRQPVRAGLAPLVLVVLASYTYAMLRGWTIELNLHQRSDVFANLVPPTLDQRAALQVSAADRGLLSLAAWAGITVLVADGVRRRADLDRLLRRLVLAASVMASLGIMQYFTGVDIAGAFRIPGLSVNGEFGAVGQRSVVRRVAATAIHPIEFGVVLAAVLPLALHYALHAPPARRRAAWLQAGLVGAALPMAVSRSGILALLVLVPAWPARWRWRALLFAPFLAVGMRLAAPGLLGTIRSLFTNLANDPSAQGRTADFGPVLRLVAESPWLGRGFFTFMPRLYRTLDDQYLLILVELGVLGFLALLVFFGAAVGAARGARRRSGEPATRHLGQALAAAVAALAVSYATFDALGFPMAASLTFLLVGCCGALWRQVAGEAPAAGTASDARLTTGHFR
ncbi:MAG: O-antigen ligase family protein [Actinomycetota bacterium]